MPTRRDIIRPTTLVFAALVAACVVRIGFPLGVAYELSARLPLESDELQHMHSAWLASEGQTPYREYFEHHTPLFYFQLAPILSTMQPAESFRSAYDALEAGRMIAWLWTVVIIVALVALGFYWRGGTRGAVTGALAACFLCGVPQFWVKVLEIRPDGPSVALVLGGTAFLLVGLGLGSKAIARQSRSVRRGPSTSACVAGGALLGLAILHTQKVLFLGPGLLLFGMGYVADAHGPGGRRQRFLRGIAAGSGVLLAALVVTAYFGARGALEEFVWFNGPFNAAWEAHFSPLPLMGMLLQENPVFFGLGAFGAALRATSAFRSARPASGDAFLIATLGSGIAGLFWIQEPYLHCYQIVLPFVALFAAEALVASVDALLTEPRYLRPVIGSLPEERATQLAAWLRPGGAAHGRGLSPAAAIVAVALAIPLSGLSDDSEGRTPKGITKEAIRWVMATTETDDSIVNGWPPFGVFRPHAWFYWSHQPSMAPMIPEAAKRRFVRRVVQADLRPELVSRGGLVEQLSPRLRRYLDRHYEPASYGFWRRKDEAATSAEARGDRMADEGSSQR